MNTQNDINTNMWRFCAYKTEKDYESGEHYFVKDFFDSTEMKVFSGEHSAKEKSRYPEYCSMYWKIETNGDSRVCMRHAAYRSVVALAFVGGSSFLNFKKKKEEKDFESETLFKQ